MSGETLHIVFGTQPGIVNNVCVAIKINPKRNFKLAVFEGIIIFSIISYITG